MSTAKDDLLACYGIGAITLDLEKMTITKDE